MKESSNCQIPCLPEMAEGEAAVGPQPFIMVVKRKLAKPWNYCFKSRLKKYFAFFRKGGGAPVEINTSSGLKAGDLVRVRPPEDIKGSLDSFNELKGCAFLESMWQYCGTTQRVLKPLEKFLDERDYKVKKCRGIVILEGVICNGTPVFGRCDRCCHLFWREEWLEKIGESEK